MGGLFFRCWFFLEIDGDGWMDGLMMVVSRDFELDHGRSLFLRFWCFISNGLFFRRRDSWAFFAGISWRIGDQ